MHIGFRLAADLVNGIKAIGRGYNARVENVLRDALAKGKLGSVLSLREALSIRVTRLTRL